jgi:hypothetical protein
MPESWDECEYELDRAIARIVRLEAALHELKEILGLPLIALSPETRAVLAGLTDSNWCKRQ